MVFLDEEDETIFLLSGLIIDENEVRKYIAECQDRYPDIENFWTEGEFPPREQAMLMIVF